MKKSVYCYTNKRVYKIPEKSFYAGEHIFKNFLRKPMFKLIKDTKGWKYVEVK